MSLNVADMYTNIVRSSDSMGDLCRVRIISTRPSASSLGRVDDSNNRTISSSNHKESTRNNDEHAPTNHQVPTGVALVLPVVVQPHAAHGLKREECTEEGTDQ